ncbi:MAG: hypothetical protein G01um101419_820 [Parcubacteria group bacterium Gr01-1014_19]|nr:MAG: hypothetical protein G01um101419_820 [Parcubacteria group bacterium Gr01-1014_19]
MCQMISCLVTKDARALGKDGVHSHTQIAAIHKVDQDRCLAYEFPLDQRRLYQDFNMDRAPFEAKQSHDRAAMSFFNDKVGTPRKLMAYVAKNSKSNDDVMLFLLLINEAQESFDASRRDSARKRDASIERAVKIFNKSPVVVKAMADYKRFIDNGLHGAALRDKYERAVIGAKKTLNECRDQAEREYEVQCTHAWLDLFKKCSNRIEVWRK